MRLSQFLAKTLRDDPAEAETANHRLMLRTGMIQQIASGSTPTRRWPCGASRRWRPSCGTR